MKKDLEMKSITKDKSVRILLESIDEYPQRLKAFKKYICNEKSLRTERLTTKDGRSTSMRRSWSPSTRKACGSNDLIINLESVNFNDDKKLNHFLTMIKDDAWKYD